MLRRGICKSVHIGEFDIGAYHTHRHYAHAGNSGRSIQFLHTIALLCRAPSSTHRKETCIMPNLKRRMAAIILMLAAAIPAFAQQVIRMSTTTSTENSGLLAYLLPKFDAKTHTKVNVIAVGTGKALELAKNGDVDVTQMHARPAEDKCAAEGHGVNRRDVMYNDFIIAGPESDPAGIKGSKDVLKAMKQIVERKAKFISRGDNSGTDQMEKRYWKSIGTQPQGSAYISAGLGK